MGAERILLTGHRGYIGCVMTEVLLKENCIVYGLDTNFFKNFLPLNDPNFSEQFKDIRDITLSDLKNIDTVIHLAAISSDNSSKLNEKATKDINVDATLRLALLAKEQGVKRFLLSSTAGIYGDAPKDDYCTEITTPNPLSPYTQSKLECEQRLSELADDNFTPVFLRNATAFGWSQRMRFDSPINSFIYTAMKQNKIVIKSDGLAWRPIVHIRDIASAFILSMKAPKDLVRNQVFNVGNTKYNFRFVDIAAMAYCFYPDLEVEVEDHPAHTSFKMDCTKISAKLGFLPAWSLFRGYEEIVRHKIDITGVDDDYSNYRVMKRLISGNEINDKYFWSDNEKKEGPENGK